MTQLTAGTPFPKQEVAQLGGGTLSLGAPRGENDWQMVVVYRGLHCPLCKKYLAQLDEMSAEFKAQGVDVVTVSADTRAQAKAMKEEKELSLAIGHDLSVDQMRSLGLYISDPRSAQETDHVFPEPGLFVINADGNLQIVDVSNAPFARPGLEGILNGIKFIRGNDYPVRGTH